MVNLRPDGVRRRGLQDGLQRNLSLLGSPEAGLRLRSNLRLDHLAVSRKMLSLRGGRQKGRLWQLSLVVSPWHRGLNATPTPQLGIPLQLKPESLGEQLDRITGIHDGQQKQDRQRGELHYRKPQRCEG